MTRRVLLPVLALLLLAVAALPAAAAHRHPHRHARVEVSAEPVGGLIAVTYQRGVSQRVQFLRSGAAIERVALRDVDNDGDVDVVAARDGRLLVWRNGGHGRFSLATPPRDTRLSSRSTRFVRMQKADDELQWGVERYDAAMPRAPAPAFAAPAAVVRPASPAIARPVSVRRSSGRAPPSA